MLIIGALLGHSSPKTTARYTHLADHPLKSAAERITETIEQYLGERGPGLDNAATPHCATYFAPADVPPEFDSVLGAVVQTRWLGTPQAAAHLGLTLGTLQTYRWMGTGPAFRKIGRRIVYAADAVEAWRVARKSHGVIALAA